MTARRTLYAAIALSAVTGLLAMHAFVAATPDTSHAGHGDHEATASTLSICVFILAGGGMIAVLGFGPARTAARRRRHPIAWSQVHFAAPLLPRRRPVTWCVLRA